MKFHSRTKRCLVFLLSFLMAFEPFVVNMVRAEEATGEITAEEEEKFKDSVGLAVSEREVEYLDTEGVDGIVDLDEVVKPVDYLEYMLSLRGRSLNDEKDYANHVDDAVAWGNWMQTISGAYAEMDDGCTDVISYYNALGEHQKTTTYEAVEGVENVIQSIPDYLTMICFATNKATLAGAFINKRIKALTNATKTSNKAVSKANKFMTGKNNLFNGFKKMGEACSNAGRKTIDFLGHMCPPVGFKKGCATGEGTVSYFRWIARKTHLDSNQKYKDAIKNLNKHLDKDNQICTNKGAKVIKDSKGIAQTIGIGLTVIGIAMDSYDLITSDDMHGGRIFAYNVIKSWVSLGLGVGSLIAMFCVPVVGQVLGVVAIVWMCLTAIADQFGDYNKKWKEAYKNSYWYLYQNDPEFKSYYDNRELLNQDEKSAAYLVTEKNYGMYREQAKQFLAENEGKNSYYDSSEPKDISSRVFIELEKQGVLSSYYNRATFKLPDFGTKRLMEYWKMKADYMAWKPNEEESVRAENRGFWGKVGHAINPMTYVSWIGNKINEIDYNKNIEKYNVEKVFCCPDYCLQKKYQAWITANKKMNGGANDVFYQTIGLRIEQAPWNYIPLVGIDTAAWNEDLLVQAFNCDSFMVGVKEMMYFTPVIKQSAESVKNSIKEVKQKVLEMKKEVDYFNQLACALEEIRSAYRTTPDDEKEGKELFKKVTKKRKAFSWKWNKDYGKQTPRNIVKVYWTDISWALNNAPVAVSTKGAECTLLVDTVKHNLDTAILMNQLYEEKQDALANFDSEFTNVEFNEYLKKGSFLDVKGSTFLDWLSEEYPAYKELEKHAKLYKEAVDEYQKIVDKSAEGRGKWPWQKGKEYTPAGVLEDINSSIDTYQKVITDFGGDVATDLSEDGLLLSPSDDKIFFTYPIRVYEELDPDFDIADVQINTEILPVGDL